LLELHRRSSRIAHVFVVARVRRPAALMNCAMPTRL
jgi:hypothetical protein